MSAPARAAGRSRALAALLPLAVALLALAAFSPALRAGFVWDDEANFVGNPHYRGLGWPELRWMATSRLMGHWIPVTWLSFGLDHALWGMDPRGYHLTNLLLHAAGAALVSLLALRLLRLAGPPVGETALRLGAAAAALVFALHPLRVESVAWVTERRDVLSGAFFLLALLAYLRARDPRAGRLRWLAASAGAYLLAMLSKSIVMSLPAILVVLDVYPLRRLPPRVREWAGSAARRVWLEKLPFLLIAAAGAAGAYANVRDKAVSLAQYPPAARVAMTAYSLWFYLWKTAVPLRLSALYELPARVDPLAPPFLRAALAVAVITAAAWLFRRRWPAGLALWLAYAAMLAPVSGLVHAGPQLVADRYSYLPGLAWALLAGAGVAAALGVPRRGRRRPAVARLAAAGAALWIAGLAGLAWSQAHAWRDAETLWRDAVEADPDCAACHGNLAVALDARGDHAAAIRHFERALALRPDAPGYERRNYGLTLLRVGRLGDAIAQFRLRLAAHPEDTDVRDYLGVSLINAGRLPEAVAQLREAVRREPGRASALTNLGIALVGLGRPAEAVPFLDRAIGINATDPLSRFALVRAHLALGDLRSATEQERVLRRLDPRLGDQALAPTRRAGR